MNNALLRLRSLMAGQPYDQNLERYKHSIYPKEKIGGYKSIGPYFYYILDWQTGKYPFISKGWKEFLDYPSSFWKRGIDAVIESVYEDDQSALLDIIQKCYEFMITKPEEELNKHSICFDYRIRKYNGEIINIVQESIHISLDKKGNIIYDLGMVTDISHLKNDGNMSLRIIGPDKKIVLVYYPKQMENCNGEIDEKLNEWRILTTQSDFIDQVHKITINNIHNPDFDVSSLSHHLNISRSQLHRKMKAIANISPNYLLKITRLQKALKLITENHHNLSEVAYRIGFSSPTYFSKCFSEEFGCSPTEFKLKMSLMGQN